MSETREYVVEGMTCDHCKASVTEEVSGVDGVESVDIDVSSGRVAITGTSFTDEEVAAAVVEAGYRLKS